MDTTKLEMELVTTVALVENMRLMIPELKELAIQPSQVYSNPDGFVLHVNGWRDYRTVRRHFRARLEMLTRDFAPEYGTHCAPERGTYYVTFELDRLMNLRLCVHASAEDSKESLEDCQECNGKGQVQVGDSKHVESCTACSL